MPTLTITNTFTNGTVADATQVNTNFTDITTLLNTTKLDNTNIQTGGISAKDKIVIGTNGTASTNLLLHRAGTAIAELVSGNDATAEGSFSTNASEFQVKQLQIGSSGTASTNIRLRRSGTGLGQIVTGDDSTAEGSTSTSAAELEVKQLKIGTSATASQNVRGRRSANGEVQWVTADDATAEGSVSTSPAGIYSKYIKMDNGVTDGGAIYFNDGVAAFLKSDSTNSVLTLGGFTGGLSYTQDGYIRIGVGSDVEVASTNDDFILRNKTSDKDLIIYGNTSRGSLGDRKMMTFDVSAQDILLHNNATGPSIYASDLELIGADFPNTTTLYGWNLNETTYSTGGTFVGSKDLTQNGTLSANNDVLGTASLRNGFGGTNEYLSSTDAVFNFTGSFSIGGWFYRASWAAIGTAETLISRITGATGWTFFMNQTNDAFSFSANGTQITPTGGGVGFTTLAAGWHHLVLVRDAGNTLLKLYIDGVKVEQITSIGTITAGGNLEFGSGAGGTSKFTGRMDEIFIHNATVLTDDQIRRIYARSARRLAYESVLVGTSDTKELIISSPTYGLSLPWYGTLYDNGITTAANNTVTVISNFIVFSTMVEIIGNLTYTTAPTNIDNLAVALLPLPGVLGAAGSGPNSELVDTGTANFNGVASIISSISLYGASIRYLAVSGTNIIQNPYTDTAPYTWANTDFLRYRLLYFSS